MGPLTSYPYMGKCSNVAHNSNEVAGNFIVCRYKVEPLNLAKKYYFSCADSAPNDILDLTGKQTH